MNQLRARLLSVYTTLQAKQKSAKTPNTSIRLLRSLIAPRLTTPCDHV
jgi:hypothetical protein